MEYKKLKVKKFAPKQFKHSVDARYWKKFKTVYAQMEEGFMTQDVSFCTTVATANAKSEGLMASATAARVDIWRMQQSQDEDADQIEPLHTIRKFDDMVTSLKIREDGQVLLTGDKLGKIQLMQISSKISLRIYDKDHKNQINALSFGSSKRTFVSCSNETSWKYFDIQKNGYSVFTCQAAHSDYIKQVAFLPGSEDLVMSGSSDKFLKLWKIDLEKASRMTFGKGEKGDSDEVYSQASLLHMNEPIEAFSFMTYLDKQLVLVANGNIISVIEITKDNTLEELCSIHAFQKPILKLAYDAQRNRIIACGLDQQIKFFELFNEATEEQAEMNLQLRLQYKIKLPNSIFTFGISPDGQHYAIGLINGSLIIKSKQLEEYVEEKDDETKLIQSAFQQNMSFKSTAKNYKYFYRGQYNIMPDADDIIQSMTNKKQKLQKYETSMKNFQYKKSLNQALEVQNPEVVCTLFEELIQRDALELALANRSPDELMTLVKFIQWKISDYRYQNILVQVLRFLIDLYSGVIGTGQALDLDSLIADDLRLKLTKEVEQANELIQLQGQIEVVQRMQSMFQ